MTAIFDDRTLSRALDAYALSIPNRPALHRDPVLWEAFTEDRETYPSRVSAPAKTPAVRVLPPPTVTRCANEDCGNLRRPKGTRVDQFPGTVCAGAYGLCQTCYRARRGQS